MSSKRFWSQRGKGPAPFAPVWGRRKRRRGMVGMPAGRFRRVGYWGRYAGAGGRAGGTQELKFHDIDWDEGVADWSAGLISNTSSLTLIGQGVTESTRIGRKAVIKSIGMRGLLKMSSISGAGLQPAQTTRLFIVLDKQANGAAPAVSGASGLLETADFQSFNSLANKGRYKVLLDKTFTFNAIAAAGDGAANDTAPVNKNFTFFKKCNIPMEYSGVANPSVITEVRTNNIFGIVISDNTTSTVALVSKLRFRFSDG